MVLTVSKELILYHSCSTSQENNRKCPWVSISLLFWGYPRRRDPEYAALGPKGKKNGLWSGFKAKSLHVVWFECEVLMYFMLWWKLYDGTLQHICQLTVVVVDEMMTTWGDLFHHWWCSGSDVARCGCCALQEGCERRKSTNTLIAVNVLVVSVPASVIIATKIWVITLRESSFWILNTRESNDVWEHTRISWGNYHFVLKLCCICIISDKGAIILLMLLQRSGSCDEKYCPSLLVIVLPKCWFPLPKSPTRMCFT